jgi:RNA polymerase sigma-54 factor
MALDLRLQQKIVQQLVMTPQLQQAIKLLQLSHLELVDALQHELEENPVLEEHAEGSEEGGEAPKEAGAAESGEAEVPNIDSEPVTEADGPAAAEDGSRDASDSGDANNADAVLLGDMLSIIEPPGESSGEPGTAEAPQADAPAGATPEPTQREVDREIDWEAYLDNYSFSLPASAGTSSGSDELPSFEASASKPTSLQDHLRWQLQMGDFSEEERRIAAMLIDEINDDGYLAPDAAQSAVDELGAPLDDVETVIREIQTFEPTGVGARDLRECLLIQAAQHREAEPYLYEIIDKHLASVEKRNFSAIAKAMGLRIADVAAAVHRISLLDPRPGRAFSEKPPDYITPDIYVYKVGSEYVIVLNEDGLPKLRVSNYYRSALQSSGGSTKSYIQDKLRSAVWLIRSIHMRQRTIYRVMESILRFQREFFDQGVRSLKTLILKDVADDIGMHESTISRVTSNKYVHTPQGLYELKFFFNSSIARVGGDSIASESVRDHIKRLIEEEDAKAPLSDQQIVELLKGRGIDIARRTIAKYREMLRLPSSSRRRQVY